MSEKKFRRKNRKVFFPIHARKRKKCSLFLNSVNSIMKELEQVHQKEKTVERLTIFFNFSFPITKKLYVNEFRSEFI